MVLKRFRRSAEPNDEQSDDAEADPASDSVDDASASDGADDASASDSVDESATAEADAPESGGSRLGSLKKTVGVALAATMAFVTLRRLRRRGGE